MRIRVWLCAAVLLAAGCGGEITGIDDELTGGEEDDVALMPASEGESEFALAPAADTPRVLYLNRQGRTYQAGSSDDPESGRSWIIRDRVGASVTIPPAPYDAAAWNSLFACVTDKYSRFNVQVTDQRPKQGPYVEISVGGLPSALRYGATTRGVAPLASNCSPYSRSVGFVFADHSTLRNSVRLSCKVITHEAGHVFGQEHEYLAADPMTYLSYSGEYIFQDVDAFCGTSQAVQCRCGGGKQNTVRGLTAKLGPSNAKPPAPPTGDKTPPQVAILSPPNGAMLPERMPLEVVVQARDDVALSDVRLYWEFTNRMLPCDNSVQDSTCRREADRFIWTLNVGTGDRFFYAVATDTSGNRAQTPTRSIRLGPPPPAQPAPTLEITAPAQNTTLTPGQSFTVRAEVSSDATIGAVTLEWTRGTDTSLHTLQKVGPRLYEVALTLAANAPPGDRQLVVASTHEGKRIASPVRTVRVP